MTLDYHATKAPVDRVDQFCYNYSMQKKIAGHLPISLTALNIVGINKMVIFVAKFLQRKKKSIIAVE